MPSTVGRMFQGLGDATPETKARIARPLLALLIAGLAWSWRDLPGNWFEFHYTDHRPLAHAKSWHYQLANVDLDKIAALDADVVVIDYAIAQVPLTAEQILKLKVKPDGRRRIVLSYLAVGEGEEKRFYWKPEWTTDAASRPPWININNCAWPGAWAVRFWQAGWKDIVFRGPQSYLARILEAGFDGVYLDRVDMFEDYPQISRERPNAAAEMIAFVAELAATARAQKPGFIVVPNNGVGLLAYREFRHAIDGQGLEELLFSEKVTGARNDTAKIRENLSLLNKLRWDYKPVFTLEYLTTQAAIDAAKSELDSLGIVSGFPTRALDGGDPTQPVTELQKNPGTPEFVAANCTKSNSW